MVAIRSHGPHCPNDSERCCANCFELLHSPPRPNGKATNKAEGKKTKARPLTDAEARAYNRQHDPQRCSRHDLETCCFVCYERYKSQSQLIARPASAYKSTPVDWLWVGRIPCGALTIFDGDPGLGKSTLTLDLAARVSRGYAMPPGSGPTDTVPANVVILSAEDDPARTIRPRLEAAGADLDRVQIVEATAVGDGDRLPILPYDLLALEDFVTQHRARLVIVDPLMAFLGDGIESHKDQSIRLALRQFAKLAERTQCGLLVIRHLNKLIGGSAMYRGGGSIGIIGAARSGLLLAKHPDDPSSRVLASVKSNLGPPPQAIVVSLMPAGPVAVAIWGDEIDMSADELLGPTPGIRRTKVEECAEAIAELLGELPGDGQMKSADLDAALKARRFKERTIKDARKKAGAKASKSSFDGEWYVSL